MAATGTRDEHYDLVSVLYHALQGVDTIDQYISDASGDDELRGFFEQVRQGYTRTADQAKRLLVGRIEHQH